MTIYLAPPNPEWPQQFSDEASVLSVLLSDRIVQIEHIGSTAISGIYAKPVIDIMISVKDLALVDEDFISDLESLNYQYIQAYEELMPFRRFFLKNKGDARTHHIHLVEQDSDFWSKHLLFRDYLRQHPEEAKKYEDVKLELAKQFTDTNEYAAAKTEICREIHNKAVEFFK